MKISFLKYGLGELLTWKRLARCIISFVAIAVFAVVCGSYLLGNKLWLLTIAVPGIAGILLCLCAAVTIFLNSSEINEAPNTTIEENAPRITSQWDYRPREAIRARAALDSPSTETSDGLSSDSFGINNKVWFSDNAVEGPTPTFTNGPPEAEEPITKALPQTTDSPCTGLAGDDDAALDVRLKSYRQSSRRG
jgi:hypothetical protein